MASSLPYKGQEWETSITLVDADSRPDLQSNPTLAAGDAKISKDYGSFSNLATLPDAPNSDAQVRIQLSSSEMDANVILIQLIDQTATKEWDDYSLTIHTIPSVAVTGNVQDSSPSTTGFRGSNNLSTTEKFYGGAVLVFTDGTLRGIGRKVTSYSTSRDFVFASGFPTTPTSGDPYMILGQIE